MAGWVGLGLLIRLLVMPVLAHHDAVLLPWTARFVALGRLDPYDAVFDQYGWRALEPVVVAPYQPLYYLVVGAWIRLLDMLGAIDVGAWIGHWNLPRMARGLLAVKAVYLPFDIGTGLLLTRLLPQSRRTLVVALWMMNPIVIWVAYIMGQNDALPAFFVVLAMVLASRVLAAPTIDGRVAGAAVLALGIGASFKLYPLLLVPLFAVTLARGPWPRLRLAILGAAPMAALGLPYLDSEAYVRGALLNPEAVQLLASGVRWGGIEWSPFLVVYLLVLATLARRSAPADGGLLNLAILVTLTAQFTLAYWPYNWIYWLVASVVLVVAGQPKILWLHVIQVGSFLLGVMRLAHEPWLLWFTEQLHAPFGFRDALPALLSLDRIAVAAGTVFVLASWAIVHRAWLDRYEAAVEGESAKTEAGWLPAVPLAATAVAFAVLLVASARMIPGIAIEPDRQVPDVELGGPEAVTQTFRSEHRNLRAIELRFQAPQTPSDHDLVLAVRRNGGQDAPEERVVTVRGRSIANAQRRVLRFATIPRSVGPWSFSVAVPDATVGEGVGVYRSEGSAYPDGFLSRGGEALDADLAFTAYFGADWSAVCQDLAMEIRGDRPFFAGWAVACALAGALAIAGRASRGVGAAAAVLLPVAVAGLLLAWGARSGPDPAFGEELTYLGHYAPDAWARPGETVRVRTYWQSQRDLDRDLTVFAHLIDAAGRTVSQDDRPLTTVHDKGLHARMPTSRWASGQIGAQATDLALPDDLAPGQYALRVGLYDPQTMQRLTVADTWGRDVDFLALPSITVVAP